MICKFVDEYTFWTFILSIAKKLNKDLKVMDATATSLCRDNKIPLQVFAISEPENIVKILQGEKIGTIVK